MTVIPCEQDPRLRAEIERYAEVLKTEAHKLGSHGLDEAYLLQVRRYSAGPSRKSAASLRDDARQAGVRAACSELYGGWRFHRWRGTATRPKARNDYYVQLKGGGLAGYRLKRVFGRREHEQV